ncbi:hypothetical protein ACWDV4_06455 [Micromonospora sp. NPDC003197]
MALPIVRSRDEAHLYLDLHPCTKCGGVDVAWESALTSDQGAPARRYHGTCTGCRTYREFIFQLPERPAVPGPDDLVFFGGPEPSRLFDAGEWRLISEAAIYEGGAPKSSDPAVNAARRQTFALGVAAIGEILKFVPDGTDAVPESCFWTPRGRARYEKNRAHFSREYLERSHQSFQYEMADRFYDL